MGILKKIFKKSDVSSGEKQSLELQNNLEIQPQLDLEEPEVEQDTQFANIEPNIMLNLDQLKEIEVENIITKTKEEDEIIKIQQMQSEPTVPSVRDQTKLFLEGLRQEADKIISTLIENKDITYENFLEHTVLVHLNEVIAFYEKIMGSKQLIEMPPNIESQLIGFKNNILTINEKVPIIKAQVGQFREKDTVLRKQILDYIKVVKQVNDKKLKGEEFEKVKNQLSPKIDELNQKRELFIQEEQGINQNIQSMAGALINLHMQFKEIAKVTVALIENKLAKMNV